MRLAAAIVAVALAVAACTPAGEPAPDDTHAVLTAREQLGPPMVELGEAVLALADRVDAARHRVPRGEEMASEVDAIADDLATVAQAEAAARAAAEDAAVPEAGEILLRSADAAAEALEAARREQRYLRRIVRIDTLLLDAAATWDERGSQSEIRARLGDVANDVEQARDDVRKLRPVPRACKVMKTNRRGWLQTVLSRTRRLQSHANSAGGSTFDELRAVFRRLPLGAEPRTADRADRACWREQSPVAQAGVQIPEDVEQLEDALSG